MTQIEASGLPDQPCVPAQTIAGAASVSPVRLWLFAVAALVFLMVSLGGATRLTGSGLSITEWQPILGAIPPLTEADWQAAFAKYRQIPQYEVLNKGMSLGEFQFIYWWEWSHRFLGRLIGIAFAIPLGFFWLRGDLPRLLRLKLLGVLGLGALQGLVGWYMVQSGLAERTEVSQYRLALHLSLAILIFGALLWLALDLAPARRARTTPRSPERPNGSSSLSIIPAEAGTQVTSQHPIAARFGETAAATPDFNPDLGPRLRRDDGVESRGAASIGGQRWLAGLLLGLIFVQIALGALVAGLRAGLTYNTWPFMDGRLIPHGLGTLQPWYFNFFENITTVQFNHRMMAYVITAAALWHLVSLIRTRSAEQGSAAILAGAVLVQAAIGIATLLTVVALPLAILHQAAGAGLFGIAVWHLHRLSRASP